MDAPGGQTAQDKYVLRSLATDAPPRVTLRISDDAGHLLASATSDQQGTAPPLVEHDGRDVETGRF